MMSFKKLERSYLLPLKWFKKWTLSDIMSFLSLIVSYLALQLAWDVSKSQQKVEGFDSLLIDVKSLLKSSDATNKTLGIQIALLNDQLALSRQVQQVANENMTLTEEGYINSLYSTTFILLNCTRSEKYFLDNPGQFEEQLEFDKRLFRQELSNPFLLRNKAVSDLWFTAYKILYYMRLANDGSLTMVDQKGVFRSATSEEVLTYNKEEIGHYINNVMAALSASNKYVVHAYNNIHYASTQKKMK